MYFRFLLCVLFLIYIALYSVSLYQNKKKLVFSDLLQCNVFGKAFTKNQKAYILGSINNYCHCYSRILYF